MANAGSSKGSFQPDSDVHITFEDQQKINKFARHNAKLDDLKEELKSKQKMLDEFKSRLQAEIEEIESQCTDLRTIMSDMKTQLYAKFGNHINLEAEDD
ncbi:Prefoldin subunit 4 [Blattella germanica]|nr:Prefoldin subunit 4 [Blattella germanica]